MENQVANYEKSLASAKVDPIEMSPLYWTPEQVGESKRMYFVDFAVTKAKAFNSDELIDLEVVRFAEPINGGVTAVENGAARLVSLFKNHVMSGAFKQGDAFEITYKGKEKNKNNNFQSDSFSVKRLIVK